MHNKVIVHILVYFLLNFIVEVKAIEEEKATKCYFKSNNQCQINLANNHALVA